MIDRDDMQAVNDLFELIDHKGLDDIALKANTFGDPPRPRTFHCYIANTHTDDDPWFAGRTIGAIVDELRMIAREAYEQGFEVEENPREGTFYGFQLHLRRGCFEVTVGAPAEVAGFCPLLTFEPREAVLA